MLPRIALATCRELPQLDADDQPLIDHLAERGIEAVPAIWSDPDVDWESFERIILRNTWDYTDRLPEFLSWCETQASRLSNSFSTVRWNTNKEYLEYLATQGIPTVPTQFVREGGSRWSLPSSPFFVVKPTVSAGSKDTQRYSSHDADSIEKASKHIDRLVAAGKTAMIQPYLDSVDSHGETALLFIGGTYSHAIRKGPLLTGESGTAFVDGLYLQEDITPREPTSTQREIAERVIALVAHQFETPLYARVDLLDAGAAGSVVLELELVEPSIFFRTHPVSYQYMSNAVHELLA